MKIKLLQKILKDNVNNYDESNYLIEVILTINEWTKKMLIFISSVLMKIIIIKKKKNGWTKFY